MSLFALPVTAAELEDLQAGIQFFTNSAQATAQAAAINAGNTTVAAYAASLLNANLSTSQVAMAATCLMLGQSATIATLTNISTQFLPDQITNALANGFEPTVYAAEALGLALAGDPLFAPFTALNVAQFSAAVSTETGVNAAAIQQFVTNWINFYTANPSATFGLTITQAAYGAAFGDAIGVALLNPTLANLQTVISTNAQGDVVIEGEVANDLLTIATGQYVPGIDCDLLPQHQALQGEAGSGPLTLTIGIDTPPQFETDVAGAVFNAPPGGNPPLGTTNTLNTGDTLVSTVGDAILNFTAVNNFLANPSFAAGVNMTGINEANILNLSDDLSGFFGEITGLTIATIVGGSNPLGDVQLGEIGAGLNTALVTLNINAGLFTPNVDPGSDVNIWVESAAFAGGEVLDINLGGVGTTVDLNVTGGANFYEAVTVSSATSPNHLDLNTNATTIATVTIDGDQDLEICGTALNQDTLTTFDSTAATGNVTAFFEGPNPGDVTAIGGAGNENFTFLTFDDENGPTTFTATDSVDGGGGDNKLTLQAFEGALLGAGVGPNIVNIQTIVHTSFENDCFDDCNYETVDANITVDMANSGSATVLELQADYNDNNVSVTNLTNADTVIYSGFDLDDLTLANAAPLGNINLTMAQDECVDVAFGPDVDHVIEDVILATAGVFNLVSVGLAAANEITGADEIDANVSITGDVDLTLGSEGEPYDFADGIIDASTFAADLHVFIGNNSQTVFGGLGNDLIEVMDQGPNEPDLIDLSAGGNDTVEFHATNPDDDDALTSANYTTITGFDIANDVIAIDVDGGINIDLDQTNGGAVDPGEAVSIPLIFGVTDNLAGVNVNFIKFSDPVSSIGFDFDATFDFYMNANGGTDITVAAAANLILMAFYDTNGGNTVLFTVTLDSGGVANVIDAGDDVQMVALVPTSFADFQTFGTAGLAFVG